MVTSGQLLERPVVVPAGGPCLDGIYLRGQHGEREVGLLVASPLPGHGGSMANPIGSELAYAAAYAGRASLRLDYRGVGGSEGEERPEPGEAAADLLEGALFLLESTGAGRVAVASVLSGAWAALVAAQREPRIDRLLLVSPPGEDPPPGVPRYADLAIPVLVVAGGDDVSFDRGAETARVDTAPNARLEVVPGASRAFRERLAALARLVPPFLGARAPG